MVTTASLCKRLKGLYGSLGGSIKIEHKKVFENILDDLTKGETVAVGSLMRNDIETMFGLKRDSSKEVWNLRKDSLEEVPSSIGILYYSILLFTFFSFVLCTNKEI
jgi:hypothetical protein